MVPPNINVHPGRNPDVLRNPQAVSGLEQWSTTALDGLRECIRDECARIFELAPPEIQDAFGATVDLPVYVIPGADDPVAMRFGDIAKLNMEIDSGKRQATVLGYTPPMLDGMLLQMKPGDNLENMRRKFGHECLHLATMLAMHPYQSAPWEASVTRLEKELYGPRQHQSTWDPTGFSATTGFAPPEFSVIELDQKLGHAMYRDAHAALDGLRAEQVWNVLATLTGKTRASGRMPRMDAIRDAFRSEGQEAGDQAMHTASFTEMREGLHHMAFAAKQGGYRVHNFAVTPNPGFGRWLALDRDDVRFTCRGVQVGQIQETLYGQDGNPLALSPRLTLGESADITFEMLAAQLGGRVPNLGDTIGVSLGSLPEMLLRRKKA